MLTLSVDDINQINAEFHDIGIGAQRLSEYLDRGVSEGKP
jgi:hypothetical protein